MKLKRIFTLGLVGMSLTVMAQTHVEGEEYYKADQFENAKDLLTRSLNNAGTDKAVSNYYLGLIAVGNDKLASAEKYFADGVAANPSYAYNYVGQGLLKLKSGDVKGAEQLFKTAEKNAKKDASLQIAIARAYDAVDPVAYEKQITKHVANARKYNLENPDIYLFEGDQAKEKKDWGGAAGKYEMAANYDKNATAAYVKYSSLFTQVNPEYAIKMLKNLLSVNPQSALGQRELANAFYNKGDYQNAANLYGTYVKNPSHFKSDESRYAFLLFYGQKFSEGYQYATKLLSEDPKNFTAKRYQFMNAAQMPEMKEKLPEMAEALYRAHMQNPKENKFAAIDFTLIASEFQNNKEPEKAIKVLEEGIKEMPANANFHKQMAEVYVDENDLAKSADAYQEYLKKVEEPGYNDYVQQAIYAYYGGAQNIKADPEKSKKYMEMSAKYARMAREIAPNQYKPVKILGDISVAEAPTDEARKTVATSFYEEAVKLLEASADPSRYKSDAKNLYLYLGNSYIHNDDVATAKVYFKKYLTLDPNNTDVRDYVSKLK
ncbi:MAG: tetratricopeptide repeat protein [Lepagella sp.]